MLTASSPGALLFFQVKILWVVMPCSVTVQYQHFRGTSP